MPILLGLLIYIVTAFGTITSWDVLLSKKVKASQDDWIWILVGTPLTLIPVVYLVTFIYVISTNG